jgi:hypothetical protein
MRPPAWPEVPVLVRDWVSDARELRKTDDATRIEEVVKFPRFRGVGLLSSSTCA